MSVIWAWPLGLLALVAWLAPLLLHLDRRRSLQTLRFAALRWIGTATRPRRVWRLSEWLLLALRLALIAAIAMWLAQPLLRDPPHTPQTWLAVVPGIAPDEIRAASMEGQRGVWLAPGFPALDTPASAVSPPMPTASLLRELDARLAATDTLRVLVPSQIDGLDARAVELGRAVDWRVAQPPIPDPAPPSPRPRRVALRHVDAGDPALTVLRALIPAWKQASPAIEVDDASAGSALPEHIDAVIWLGGEPDAAAMTAMQAGATLLQIPASVSASGKESMDETAWPPRAERVGDGRLLRLDGALRPQRLARIQSADFPAQMSAVLFPPRLPARALADDVQPLQVERARATPELPLWPWLTGLIAVLFLLERLLANGRRLARSA